MPSPRIAVAIAALITGCSAAAPPPTAPVGSTPPRVAPLPSPVPAVTTEPRSSGSRSAPAETTTPAADVPAAALRVEQTLAAGKWPEGVVVDDGVAWVAESGSRRVLRIPLQGDGRSQPIGVGRLPVELLRGPSGKLYTLARTDRTVWEIDPTTARARPRWTVQDCPESMTLDGGVAWLLLWGGCTSSSSSVVRIDLATGARRSSADLGAGAWRIGHAAERVWISGDDATVRSVGAAALDDLHTAGSPGPRGGASQLVAGGSGVFVTSGNDVLRIDPDRRARTHATTLGEPIAALALDEGAGRVALLAAGTKGTLWEIDPATMTVRRRLTSPVADAQPRSLATWGERFVVTDHGADGERGRLHVLSVAPER